MNRGGPKLKIQNSKFKKWLNCKYRTGPNAASRRRSAKRGLQWRERREARGAACWNEATLVPQRSCGLKPAPRESWVGVRSFARFLNFEF
jgi:hypothetical protein